MALELTPAIAGNSLIVLGISYIVTLAFGLYSLYLNWKQSKVKDQMRELIDEVKAIHTIIQQKELSDRLDKEYDRIQKRK